MSTFFLSYLGNPELKVSHIGGFFFVINELNKDNIRLYTNYMMYKAWSKILNTKRLLYLHDDKFIRSLFKNLSESYVQGMTFICILSNT